MSVKHCWGEGTPSLPHNTSNHWPHVLSGGYQVTGPGPRLGYPILRQGRVHQSKVGRYSSPRWGYPSPRWGVPSPRWEVPPSQTGTPFPVRGTPVACRGYPPPPGTGRSVLPPTWHRTGLCHVWYASWHPFGILDSPSWLICTHTDFMSRDGALS